MAAAPGRIAPLWTLKTTTHTAKADPLTQTNRPHPRTALNPAPNDAYLSSTWSGAYCDNGTAGTGTFRLDAGCWTGYKPAIRVTAGGSDDHEGDDGQRD